MTYFKQLECEAFTKNDNGSEYIELRDEKIRGMWVKGFYAKRCLNTPCPVKFDNETYIDKEPEYQHCLVVEIPGDWGMPGKFSFLEIIPETVCKCTGMTDSFDHDIYEDDIVTYQIFDEDDNEYFVRYWIYYDSHSAMFMAKSLDTPDVKSLYDLVRYGEFVRVVSHKYEVKK